MKILFIGLNVGAGLVSICKSVKNLIQNFNYESEYVDIYEQNKKRAKFSSEFYYKIVKVFPHIIKKTQNYIYNKCYKTQFGHKFIDKDVYLSKIELLKILDKYKPDVIYTPVNFVAHAIDELIEEKKVAIKYFYQIPDFMVSFYSQTLKHCTLILSPCKEVSVYLKKFYKENINVVTTSLPVNSKFFEKQSKVDLLNKLNLKNGKYIIVSNGGAGCANNFKIVKQCCEKFKNYNFIIVNGKNEKNKLKIDSFIRKNKIKNVVNLGFINNMNEYMAISSIMIGKCGSSTLCEASAMKLKYIAFNNNLFPEIKNIEYLNNRKACFIATNVKEIEKGLNSYINDEKSSKHYIENFAKINEKNSNEIIKETLLNNINNI